MTRPAWPATWPRRHRPLIVGHRGAMGYAPENTIASFELALQQGADAVELDVQLSRDGEAVVIHDELLDRTTSGRGLVCEHSLAELRELDAGRWFDAGFAGERLPTLDEALRWAADRLPLVIEIKNSPVFYEGIAQRLVDLVRRRDMLERALIISFDHRSLRRVHELEPAALTGVIYSYRPVDQVALARAAGASVLEPEWMFVRAEDVTAAHAGGLLVNTWACSDPVGLRHLIESGVDGITTNHPDVLARLLAEAG